MEGFDLGVGYRGGDTRLQSTKDFRAVYFLGAVGNSLTISGGSTTAGTTDNIAGGHPLPFKTIMEKARDFLGSKSEFSYVDYPEFNKVAQAYNYSVNGDKLKALGFEPEISFDEGLKSLCS